MTRAFGIDISKWQSSKDGKRRMDFDAVKNHSEAVRFIAARAAVSWSYIDPMFDYYWSEMLRLGVGRIAYHVIYFGESPISQMDSLFTHIENAVNWAHDRIALDLEVEGINTKARITATTQKCIEICQSRTGRTPIIYTQADWANKYLELSALPTLDWWLASYKKAFIPPFYTKEHPGPPDFPQGVDHYLIHQTTVKGRSIGGRSHYMNYNRWNGDEHAVASYFGGKSGMATNLEEAQFFRAMALVSALSKRSGPGSHHPVVGTLSLGEVVSVYEEREGWFRIDALTPVWVQGKPSLMRRLDDGVEEQRVLYRLRCIVPALYKRNGPGKEHTVMGNLIKNQIVDVYEEQNGWVRISPEASIWCDGGRQYFEPV